jgi:hypothetical protein
VELAERFPWGEPFEGGTHVRRGAHGGGERKIATLASGRTQRGCLGTALSGLWAEHGHGLTSGQQLVFGGAHPRHADVPWAATATADSPPHLLALLGECSGRAVAGGPRRLHGWALGSMSASALFAPDTAWWQRDPARFVKFGLTDVQDCGVASVCTGRPLAGGSRSCCRQSRSRWGSPAAAFGCRPVRGGGRVRR